MWAQACLYTPIVIRNVHKLVFVSDVVKVAKNEVLVYLEEPNMIFDKLTQSIPCWIIIVVE